MTGFPSLPFTQSFFYSLTQDTVTFISEEIKKLPEDETIKTTEVNTVKTNLRRDTVYSTQETGIPVTLNQIESIVEER